ncbi:MAG: hypothetical protein ACK5XN_32900, partial [Bacteroidota bacterium]
INGVLLTTLSVNSGNINDPSFPRATTKLGQNWPSINPDGKPNEEWYKGLLDEVRFYNRALIQEEITYLANN